MIAAFFPSIEIPSGLQRLHGRKPVALAAASVSCSWTFLRSATDRTAGSKSRSLPPSTRSSRPRSCRGRRYGPSADHRPFLTECLAVAFRVSWSCRFTSSWVLQGDHAAARYPPHSDPCFQIQFGLVRRAKAWQLSSRWPFRRRSTTRFLGLAASFPGTDAFAGHGVVSNHEEEDRYRRRRMNEPTE
jgi:hypothetical protein